MGEQRYRGIFDAAPVALLVIDRAGIVCETNPAAAALFATEPSALRGCPLSRSVEATGRARMKALVEGGGGSLAASLERRDGTTFAAHVTCAALEDGEASVVVVEPVDPAIERLERADAAKDRFIAMLSHDLRGPINAVLGWTRMLRTEQLSKASRVRALETIERSARNQLALVQELLDVSRIAADKVTLDLRAFDLRACAQQVVDASLPVALDANVSLTAELSDEAAPILADRERILQVASNLVSNALKFTPGGGCVRVGVRAEAPHAVLEVTDDGHGIDPAVLPQLFECYRQADDPVRGRAGLGLGLYIVRQLVEAHGGHVAANSAGRGKGARMTVFLPLAREKGTVPSIVALPLDDVEEHLDSLRVLVVDDELDQRELLATLLSGYGAEVTAAGDASQALAMFRSRQPHVVVSDLEMPGADGFALIQSLRACAADVPAIAVSGLAGHADAERAHDAGFDAHFAKPIEARALVKCVRELSARRRRA